MNFRSDLGPEVAESGTKLFLFCLDLYLYTVAIFKVKMFFVFLAELGNSSSLPAAKGPIPILLIFSLAGLSCSDLFRVTSDIFSSVLREERMGRCFLLPENH